MREYQVIKERDEPYTLAAQESDRVTHHRREYERGRGEAERQYHKLVRLTVPFEPEELGRIGVHGEVVVGTGDIRRATPTGSLEEGPALPLEGLHAKRPAGEVPVHVPSVPNETFLPRTVHRHPEG